MDGLPGYVLITIIIIQYGYPAINLSHLSLQPEHRQYFKEQPENRTVIEGESVTLRCTIGNLVGKVQWSTDGFAMGYELDTIRSYCPKCSPKGNNAKGEYHLYVEDVQFGRFNEFECQVSPDHQNQHEALRARAVLNVLVPPSKLELVHSEASISLNSGAERQLSCRARDARPQAKIVWYQGDHKIVDQEYSNQVTQGIREGTWDTINTLKFRANARDDGSSIRCVAEHPALKHARLEKKIDLTVYYPPGEPLILGGSSHVVREGDMINVTCVSQGGNPPPQMSWYKENIKLQYPTVRLNNGTTVSHLYIRAEQSHLTDVFSCRAWNKVTTSALVSRDVKFNVTFSGDRVHISGPDSAQIGTELTLQCSSQESNPPSLIKWTIGGVQQFGTQEKVAVSQGGWKTTSILKKLVNGNTMSQMKVTCSAVNDLYSNEIQDTKVIQILRPPEAPTITGLPTVTLREGDILELTCISRHGSPLPTLKWLKQGEYIENQNFTRKEAGQSVAKLFVMVSRSDNDVEYSCEASNGAHFPSVSQKTKFSVYFEPRYARLYLSHADSADPTMEIQEIGQSTVGDRLQLNCLSGLSNPTSTITWFRNGIQVRGGEKIVKSSPKNNGYLVSEVLKLNGGNPITSLDNGSKFSCSVSNPAINGNNVTKDYILNVRFPPEFTVSFPANFSVIEGDDITINVTAAANPPIKRFSWKPLQKNRFPDHFHIKDSTIEIRGIQRDDAGLYLLEAANQMGEKSKEVSLTVLYHALITNITSEVIADEGETAEFHCVVDAKPINEKTVSWGRSDDRNYDFDERVRTSYDGNMTFTMKILRVRKSDRGEYFCRANNHLGGGHNHTKTAVLKIKFKPEIRNFPRFSKFAQNLMHQIDLKCVAYGYPAVKIFWRKAGEHLDSTKYIFDNDGRTKKIGYSTWESTLTIESVTNSLYGTYQCVAENDLGKDSFNISLTTKSRPEPPVNLEVIMKNPRTIQLKWEPGFNGGFDQYFKTKIKDVTSGKSQIVKTNPSSLSDDDQFVYQDVVDIDPDVKYAFSVKSVNVQGSSDFSRERIKELIASENKAKDKDAVPRVIIVAMVLGAILFVIIKLMIITCCIKQRKENKRREEKKLERSSSLSSKRSMMIDRYASSKYADPLHNEMFVSPPSRSGSNISIANDHQDYKYLGRSLSTGLGAESDRGYDSYRAGTCSVHGTLKRHVSSGIDTTMEEDVFDDFSGCDTKPNGGPAFPFPTADMMLKTGAGRSRSRAGSLSSPTHVVAPPRLGVSGLYTDHMERRKYSIPASNSLSPPMIPSPPPPVNTSTLSRKHHFHAEKNVPLPPPPASHCNGHINMVDFNISEKQSAIEASNDLTRRIAELGQERSIEPGDSLGHLQIKDLPGLSAYPQLASNQKYLKPRSGTSNTTGYM